MPDITMCEGEIFGIGKDICDRRDTCYRYTATPSEHYQSFFTMAPHDIVDGKQVCEHYWPNYDEAA